MRLVRPDLCVGWGNSVAKIATRAGEARGA